MLTRQTIAAAVLGICATLVAVQATQVERPLAQGLTVQDYFAIQQLVNRYSYALDTGANDGYAYADLFAPNAAFGGRSLSRDQLAATARPGGGHYPRGPKFVFHYTSNHVIEPSTDGATGKVYVVEIDAGERGKRPALIEDGGHYEDVYTKTPEGWRFKSRIFVKTEPGTPPSQAR